MPVHPQFHGFIANQLCPSPVIDLTHILSYEMLYQIISSISIIKSVSTIKHVSLTHCAAFMLLILCARESSASMSLK